MGEGPAGDTDEGATETRWLNEPQQRAWRAFVVGSTLLFDRLDDELRQSIGIGLNEYEVLVRISERPGRSMRMSALANAMCHSRSRITHTVARMERAGLVERTASLDDGRGIVAHLTDQGYELLVTAAPTHVEGVRDHLVDLASDEDFAAVRRVMDAVVDQLAEAHPEADLRTNG